MGLPTITVEFRQLAETASSRSTRGILAVIIQDETASWPYKIYTAAADLSSADFTPDNFAAINRAFVAGPYQVIVIRLAKAGTMADAKKILEPLSYNWLCAVPAALQADVVAYIKEINTPQRIRKAKALVSGQANADDIHVVNVANETVTMKGGDGSPTEICAYLPRLAGLLAACPMDASVTYALLDDLEDVKPVSNLDTSIDSGNLCLMRDDGDIRIARGVTTRQTIATPITRDMQKIAIVEAMDLIQEDIIRVFKRRYLGKKRNTADNQALFVSDILSYLHTLADEDILNRDAPIEAAVDVSAMRKAWEDAGSSVAQLTDRDVKRKPFRSCVFITARAQILDAMEDLPLVFYMG